MGGGNVLFMLFVFIFTYWCPTRFLYQMMFVKFNSTMTGVTCGAETVNPSGTPQLTPGFNWVHIARSLVFCVMLCRSLFVFVSFFFWPLCCLSFLWPLCCLSFFWPVCCLSFFWPVCCLSFDLRLLLTLLVYYNFSYNECLVTRF